MKFTVLLGILGLSSCVNYKPTTEDVVRAIEAAGYISQRIGESSK